MELVCIEQMVQILIQSDLNLNLRMYSYMCHGPMVDILDYIFINFGLLIAPSIVIHMYIYIYYTIEKRIPIMGWMATTCMECFYHVFFSSTMSLVESICCGCCGVHFQIG